MSFEINHRLDDPTWSSPPDGETTEEMLRVLDETRTRDELEAMHNRRLWEKRDYYGRDGSLVVRPPRAGS